MTSSSIKISLVTPNFNGGPTLEATLQSVLTQKYPNLEYIVVDGASTDNSMEVISGFASQITHVVCEPDTGHANAINKGFALATGEVMGWLNSDDMLLPGSLTLLNELFGSFPDLNWLTGRPVGLSESGVINQVRPARPWSWLRFISGDHRYIQQESTFWRRDLWDRAGATLDEGLALANDFDLWSRMFMADNLYTVDALIGSFRHRPGQRSIKFKDEYDREQDQALKQLRAAIPEQLWGRHREILERNEGLVHNSFQFEQVPTELAVCDPNIIRFDHVEKTFGFEPSTSELVSELNAPAVAPSRNLRFAGNRREVLARHVPHADTGYVRINIRFEPDTRSIPWDHELGDGKPTCFVAGAISLEQSTATQYEICLHTTVSEYRATFTVDSHQQLTIHYRAGRALVEQGGNKLAELAFDGEPVAQLEHVHLGAGLLSTYWGGVIHAFKETFTCDHQITTVLAECAHDASPPSPATLDRQLFRTSREVGLRSVAANGPHVDDLSQFHNKHAGERCFVVGNGPSLNKTPLSLLNGETVFASNACFLLFDRIGWRPSYYSCVDTRVLCDRAADIDWMLSTHPEMTAFLPAVIAPHDDSGNRFDTRSAIPPAAGRFYFNEKPNSEINPPESMFSLDIDRVVFQPYTVTITLLQLAAYMGFAEIYLIGCDTSYTVPTTVESSGRQVDGIGVLLTSTADDDANHFDPTYFGQGRQWHHPQVDKMITHYSWAKKALAGSGSTVYNATVGGKLEVFPRRTFEGLFS